MAGTFEQDRRALYEIAIVLAVVLGAVAGALAIVTGLPLLTILIGAAAIYVIAFVVVALAAS